MRDRHHPGATAAADPPLDPLVERSRSHGLRVGPNSTGSQAGAMPNSGVFVLPEDHQPGPAQPDGRAPESKVDTLPRQEPASPR